MTGLLIRNVRLATRDGVRGWARAVDGRIECVGEGGSPSETTGAVLEGEGCWLLPGFIDAHIHGSFGQDVMSADPEELRQLARGLVRHGVTAFAPTVWTASATAIRTVLRAIASMLGPVEGGATVLPAHVEGPYLSDRRCGAQPPEEVRPYDPEELAAMVSTGAMGRMTVAPEVPANAGLVRALVRAGVEVSMGHSDADVVVAGGAVELGARGVTHLFNAMPPLHHRRPGLAGVALGDARLLVEVIADGVHVHPGALRAAWAAKGPDGLALVTDALRPAGLPADRAVQGGRILEVRDGAVWLDRTTLAGSSLTLDRAFRNLAAATGADPATLWPTVSRTPARLCGVGAERGDLLPGLVADAVLLDDALEVVATVAGGAVVHDRRSATAAGPAGTATREVDR